jgi:hypothetical protein
MTMQSATRLTLAGTVVVDGGVVRGVVGGGAND